MRKCKLIQLFWYSKFLVLMQRTITPHQVGKALSLVGPFMKEKNCDGLCCWEAIEYYHVLYCLLQDSFNTLHNLSHWRCFQVKNYITWTYWHLLRELLYIISLKNWAMSGLQSWKMFTALFLHSALSKYNWSSITSCGYSIKMLSK